MLTNDEYRDFWNEYKLSQDTPAPVNEDEDHIKLEIDEVENNAELLRAMGMGHLVEVFNQCREINESELDVSTRQLSKRQADTVRKRVRALNHTVKSRIPGRQGRGWQRKPDIRNVFRDLETSSTGTRSRSATPDSLDSINKLDSADNSPESQRPSPWQSENWTSTDQKSTNNLVGSVPSFVKIFNQTDSNESNSELISNIFHTENGKETLRRTPSAPPSCNRRLGDEVEEPDTNPSNNESSLVVPPSEIFGRPSWTHYRGDVAGHSDGIELVGFNRIGTLYCPRNSRERARAYRDNQDVQIETTRNVDALVDTPSRRSVHLIGNTTNHSGPMSFEMAFSKNVVVLKNEIESDLVLNDEKVLAEHVSDLDFKDMTPILWVELCMIFDKHSIKIQRRKPLKRKRKEDGNLFGVNLSTLVMRDYRVVNDTSVVPVPLIIRDLLNRLSQSYLRDEGILRVAGNKQRVEHLCQEIETSYYEKPEQMRLLLDKSTSHELVSVLKKLLRDLPQPLLTFELIHLFYQIHGVNDERDQLNALHILVLLLPVENRTTLYSLLKFLIEIVRNESFNKMNLHNVAMIIAPSLFPSRYVFSNRTIKNDLSAEIVFAATCCKLTESLIKGVDLLQTIPADVLKQARNVTAVTPNCNRRTRDHKQAKHGKSVFTKKEKK